MKGKGIRDPLYAFGLAVGIFLLLAVAKGFYPFGKNTVLQVDLFHQYAPFQAELRSRLLNGQSLIYSWEGGLGKAFFSQIAYYTASPFSFLAMLVPEERIADFMLFLIGFKMSLAAAFFTYYLESHLEKESREAILWGILYAYSGFMTAYYWNVMWLDDLALFPLITAGIDRLIRKGDGRLYLISLGLGIISNFYIAFLVCIGSLLYFAIQTAESFQWSDRKQWLKTGLHYGLLSILAGGLGGFLLIPAAISLSQTAASSADFSGFEIYQNFWQIGESHLLGAVPQVLVTNDKPPNIGCGLLALILASCFFLDSRVSKRRRIVYGSALFLLLACCVFRPLDFMIHGLHFPANIPHRFMFIYVFLVLTLGYDMWSRREELTEKMIFGAALFWGGILMVSEYLIVPANRDLIRLYSEKEVLCNLFLLAGYGSLLLFFCQNKRPKGSWHGKEHLHSRQRAFFLLLCLVTGECFYSGYNGFIRKTAYESYGKNMAAASEVREFLDEREKGDFYRMEFRRFQTINDSALFHYHGLSQFSSMAPGGISRLMERLGFSGGSNSYRYYDPTPLLDGIFNIRYVVEKTDDGNGGMKNPYYQYVDSRKNLEIYENPRALGMGFVVSPRLEGWQTENSCPFTVQNEFARLAAELDQDLFTLIPLEEIKAEHMEITDSDSGSYFEYKVDDPYSLENIPKLYAEISVREDGHYFLWVQAGQAKRLLYEWEGQRQDRELSVGKSLFDMRHIPREKKVKITIPMNNRSEHEVKFPETGEARIYVARYNDEAYEALYQALSREPWQIKAWGDTFMEGEVEADAGGLLWTSIPYERGWQVFVNGERVSPIPLGRDGVVGVSLKPGRSSVRLEYRLPGIGLGIGISLLSLAACLGLAARQSLSKRKRKYL
ncbi:YfhO family protein [Lachnospiraceae bacterium 62-35]